MSNATDSNTVSFEFYHYHPNMGGAVLFIFLFIATTGYHAFQMFRTRTWFLTSFVVGGVCQSVLPASIDSILTCMSTQLR
jgi:hypothetical protein